MPETTTRLTYRGPAAGVSLLAQVLQEAGVRVVWEAPREERGASEVVENVVGTLIATGTYEGIKAAVRRFTDHMKGRAEVVEEEDDDGG